MKISITIPALNPPHGGLRVIIEWANRLCKWHTVYLYVQKPGICTWKHISRKVIIVNNTEHLKKCNCLIISSPHAIALQNHPDCPPKVFIFMQMLEHMFRPDDIDWQNRCKRFYQSPHPLIAISQWNIRLLKEDWLRTGPIHYVGNGVNLDDFPPDHAVKQDGVVLVEGWEGYNPAKDIDHIGPAVASMLKADGYTILAYGQMPIQTMPHVPHKYYRCPDIKTINDLYNRATILLKASRYDARSCSPVEAMTKGTVTARAIVEGDDDLIHNTNCLRVGYNAEELYTAAKRLLTNEYWIRDQFSSACHEYVQTYTWDYWMKRINEIISS